VERRARPEDSRLGIVQYPMAVDVFGSGGSRVSNSKVQIAWKRGVFRGRDRNRAREAAAKIVQCLKKHAPQKKWFVRTHKERQETKKNGGVRRLAPGKMTRDDGQFQ
jgi:hypothetical protein